MSLGSSMTKLSLLSLWMPLELFFHSDHIMKKGSVLIPIFEPRHHSLLFLEQMLTMNSLI